MKFPIKDSKNLFEIEDTYFVIWTTTPWTLVCNEGITIGESFEYSLLETEKGKLIIASELVEKVMELAEISNYKTLKTFAGEELEGITYNHPFLDKVGRVVLGSVVFTCC